MFTLTERSKNVNTNDEDVYYTYVLINPISNKPFYVGKGKGTRKRYMDHFSEAIKGKGSNKHKINTIRKIIRDGHDVIVDVVFGSTSEKECLEKEVDLIAQYGRRDISTGILTNLTNGGEGVSGFVFTETQRKERSERQQGKNNHMYGKTRTSDERAKISATKRKMIAEGKTIPTKHTEKHKQKLREHNPGGEATARAIYQIDTNTGRIIKQWKSSRNAGIELGIKSYRNISIAAKKKTVTAGGFYWRWVDDSSDIFDGILQNFEQYNEYRTDRSLKSGKQVLQISDDGTETIWKNMCIAGEHYGLSRSAISSAIKYNRKCVGCWWKKQ